MKPCLLHKLSSRSLKLFSPAALVIWALTAGYAAGQVHAEGLKIGGTGGSLATMQMLADAYVKAHPGTTITVLPSLGSGGGIKALLSGSIQIAVSARALKDSEIKQGAVAIEYGRTPFVFATQSATKADGITTANIANIYAGKLDKWPDGTHIRLVLRPVGDSDSDMIKNISDEVRRAKLEAESRPGMLFAITDQDAANHIGSIKGSFGPSTLSQILSEKLPVKALGLNKITPSASAIADGSYPYYKKLYVVTGPKSSPAAQGFLAFIRTAEGRSILTRTEHWIP